MSVTPAEARTRFRDGLATPTSGWCPGFAQTNLIAVPRGWAYDFLLFTQRNPQACPVLDVGDPGNPTTALAQDADVRTDLLGYRVWRDGRLVDEPTDVLAHWRDDLVTFHIGCSFTFETALVEHGIPAAPRRAGPQRADVHHATGVPSRRAGERADGGVHAARSRPTSSGRWCGSRPACRPCTARRCTWANRSRYRSERSTTPTSANRWSSPTATCPFWAGGVTAQAAVMASTVPFALTHAPGHMLITDVPDRAYRL